MNFTGFDQPIPITAEHLEIARRRDSRRSPVAAALFNQYPALNDWCIESTPDSTVVYGYQTFGKRRLFTAFIASHDLALTQWLEHFEQGKKLSPITIHTESVSSMDRALRFELHDSA